MDRFQKLGTCLWGKELFVFYNEQLYQGYNTQMRWFVSGVVPNMAGYTGIMAVASRREVSHDVNKDERMSDGVGGHQLTLNIQVGIMKIKKGALSQLFIE